MTLDPYAQVVTEQHKAAVDATAARFLDPAPGGGRWMQSPPAGTDDGAETRREGL
ncbi:MAG TPA: hypothetical protein VFZ85_15145 [Jiangellaceae bacterium]